MKKSIKILSSLLLTIGLLTSCNPQPTSSVEGYGFKAGLITVEGDESTYDANFINAFKAACTAKGVTPVISTNVPESSEVTEQADNMVDGGCKFVFADSFNHETFLLESAKKHDDVQFAHATGTYAHTEKRSNFHNAFASIYEGRYLAGVAAGLKLQEMIDAGTAKTNEEGNYKLGYVGAYTYAEVISGYTSWYLGAKSVVDNVVMDVQFTGSWYNVTGEQDAAKALIAKGAQVISQHADSWGAPQACEDAGVPDVSYNGSTESKCPNTFVISSKINWQPYFEYTFDCIHNGTAILDDYVGELGEDLYSGNGSVQLTEPGAKAAAKDTKTKLNEVAKKLRDGSLKVFDCSKFTVDGEHLTSYLADVDTDPNYTKDTEAIVTKNGLTYFAESEFRSAPYFDVNIDGINLLNAKY